MGRSAESWPEAFVFALMAKVKTLEELFIHQLQDLYNAEDQLIKALPKVAKKANDPKLVKALESHLEETKGHKETVAQILKDHDEKPGGEVCKAMQGLIKETDEHLADEMTPEVTDALIIACAQRVEHYEIAGYGTASTFAEMLDMPEHAEMLRGILDQEKGADTKLTEIAMGGVNAKADGNSKSKASASSAKK